LRIELSIIYVNYYSKSELERSLASVEKFTKSAFEILIVNNSPLKENFDNLESENAHVRTINSAENYGFGKACNMGISQAKGNFILLLNPDTFLKDNAIDSCLEAYKKLDPEKTGAFTCRHINEDGSFQYSSCRRGDLPRFPFIRVPWKRASLSAKDYMNSSEKLQSVHGSSGYTYAVHGSFLMARKELLEQTPFDEDFFLYSEEIDLCRRLNAKGKKSYYYAEATIVHSSHRANESASIRNQMYLSSALLVLKMYGKGLFLFYHGLRVLRTLCLSVLIPFLPVTINAGLKSHLSDAKLFSKDYLKILRYKRGINSHIPLKSAALN